MKISEMNNEQAADALVRIAGPMGSICDDEQITDMIMRYKALEETPMIRVLGKFLPELAAVALKKHRDDLFEIVGALTQKTRAEAAKMNFLETVAVIRDALNDEAFTDFFPSSGKLTKARDTESARG